MIQQRASLETYQISTWRLLDTGWQDGATNMAIDEAILEGVARGSSPPTLRFYGWQPACLSLGYAQPWSVVDLEACRERGWDVVRRATGGRAILHVDELTYSVCLPESEPRVRGGILSSYRRLSDALALGLESMGLEPSRAMPEQRPGADGGAACFDGPSNYEITVGRRKLVGSAQARKKGVVLQHGSLPLYGDITRIVQALAMESAEQRGVMARGLRTGATTLESGLGRRMEYEAVTGFLRKGFAGALNLKLEKGKLSEEEVARTAQVRAEKYASEEWTRRL